jgi:hypothetical protein
MDPIKLNPEEWKRVPFWIKLKIAIWLIWVVYLPLPALPRPIHYSVIASLMMFLILSAMPHHPMMIPVTIGGGLAAGLILAGVKYG